MFHIADYDEKLQEKNVNIVSYTAKFKNIVTQEYNHDIVIKCPNKDIIVKLIKCVEYLLSDVKGEIWHHGITEVKLHNNEIKTSSEEERVEEAKLIIDSLRKQLS